MIENRKKQAERYYVDHVRTYYPGTLPDSPPSDFEEPDFLFEVKGAKKLGLEVMQLFHPTESGEFPELQVARFHRDVTSRAAKIYAKLRADRPVDITAYFDMDVRMEGLQKSALNMASTVADLDFGTHCKMPGFPPGLSVIGITPAQNPEVLKWSSPGNSHTPLLTKAFLGAAIAKKNALVPRYRLNAERVWLLLVSSLGCLQSTFAAPDAITDWRFDYAFDQVLLLTQEPGEIHVLKRS